MNTLTKNTVVERVQRVAT